jgi:hypothetical protein
VLLQPKCLVYERVNDGTCGEATGITYPQTPTADAFLPRTCARPRTSGLKLAKLQFNINVTQSRHNSPVNSTRHRRALTMPPKQRTPASTGPSAATSSTPAKASRPTSSSTAGDAQDILQGVWSKYVQKTPQRVKLLDTFMVFLVVVGALQFLYVVLVGNFVRTSLPDCSIGLSKGRYRLLGANNRCSLSTPSSRASAQRSASSSSRPRSACRRTRKTRQNLGLYRMRGPLRTLLSDRCCCTFSV